MTIRTGKGGRYRYYSCSTAARQGETGCKGRAIPMKKLDDLVAGHLKERLLDPERLSEILATVLDRRQDRAERRREHIGELNRRAAEADARLRRLYGAIESGIADPDDPALKERVAELKATRDQAQADAQRAAQTAERISAAITPDHVAAFAKEARERIRLPGGGYRRDLLRALAQRVEVAEREVSPNHGNKGQSVPNARRRLGRKIGYRRRAHFCSELAEQARRRTFTLRDCYRRPANPAWPFPESGCSPVRRRRR